MLVGCVARRGPRVCADHTGHGRRTRMRLASFVACIPCIIARSEICRLQTLHNHRCEMGGARGALLAAAVTSSAAGTDSDDSDASPCR